MKLEYSKEAIEEWLRKNTITCPLGRITKEQCFKNRCRPKVNEISKKRNFEGIEKMPFKCMKCEIWKDFYTPDEIKKQEEEIKKIRKSYSVISWVRNSSNKKEEKKYKLPNFLYSQRKCYFTSKIIFNTKYTERKIFLSMTLHDRLGIINYDYEQILKNCNNTITINDLKQLPIGKIEKLISIAVSRKRKIGRCIKCNEINVIEAKNICKRCYFSKTENKLENNMNINKSKYIEFINTNFNIPKDKLEKLTKKELNKLIEKHNKTRKRIIVCRECGEVKINLGKGLCGKCYQRLRKKDFHNPFDKLDSNIIENLNNKLIDIFKNKKLSCILKGKIFISYCKEKGISINENEIIELFKQASANRGTLRICKECKKLKVFKRVGKGICSLCRKKLEVEYYNSLISEELFNNIDNTDINNIENIISELAKIIKDLSIMVMKLIELKVKH